MTTYYVDTAVGNDGNAGTSEGSGNAWATIQKAADTAVAGDIVWVKASGSYAEAVDFDTNSGGADNPIRFFGYTSTTGDGGQVTVTAANTRAYCFNINNVSLLEFANFYLFDATSECLRSGSTTNQDGISFFNCRFDGNNHGAPVDQSMSARQYGASFIKCIFENSTSSGVAVSGGEFERSVYINCIFRNNTDAGILNTQYGSVSVFVSHCLFHENGIGFDGGASGTAGSGVTLTQCTFDANTTAGIRVLEPFAISSFPFVVDHCIFSNHSGAGDKGILAAGTASNGFLIRLRKNAFYNNTTDSDYAEADWHDHIALSADPFTDSANDDYTLNNTSGGGADLRNAGDNNQDIGYWQHTDAGGGGGGGRQGLHGIEQGLV